MQTLTQLQQQNWYRYLDARQQALVMTSAQLLTQAQGFDPPLPDYSYLVFPVSKAYEGFLKKFLLDLNLISKRAYVDRHFRIGRSLNPDVRKNQRDEYWLYDDVERQCGQETARLLWNAWLECRNQIFHYFPDKPRLLDLAAAISRLELLENAMEAAVDCLEQNYKLKVPNSKQNSN